MMRIHSEGGVLGVEMLLFGLCLWSCHEETAQIWSQMSDSIQAHVIVANR